MLIKTLKKRIAKLKDTDDMGVLIDTINPEQDCFWVARNGKVIRKWKLKTTKEPSGLQ